MKTVNYINREYVNPIDLNVVGKTYDTLEQGHQEAVKAASDLEITMANLDLNEAEAQWRQNKIAEIKQTVTDNSNYGNAYGALDDIIAQAGNIASDQGMIGRLQAQKDYKAYKDNLDKRNDLPENYKEYFREMNPYQYQDKVDEKTGTIIGGTKWQPRTSPTQVVPLNQLIDQGLKWAAKESGGGEMTRWIDANGKVTSDPNQAFDGQVYNNTTNKWERLSKTKIREGIQASINTTPGAKESIVQDYNIAAWNHGKQVTANNGKPVVSEVTDRNGILLNQDQYLFKRIDPAVQAASYHNSISGTNYGQGLATYKLALKTAMAAGATGQQRVTDGIIAGRDTPVDVPVDAASNFIATKNMAAEGIKSLYKQLTGRAVVIGDDEKIGNMEKLLDAHSVPTAARQQLRSLVKAYNEGSANLKGYTEKMTPEDKANFEFAARIKAGGALKSSVNGGSVKDDEAIARINMLYSKDGENVQIDMNDDNLTKTFQNLISGGSYNGYRNLGISINGNTVTIPKKAMQSVPLIFDALEKAKKATNEVRSAKASLWDKLSTAAPTYTVKTLDKDNQELNNLGPGRYRDALYKGIAGVLSDADALGKTVATKYKIQNSNVQLSSINLDGNHFADATLLDQYNKGLISKEQYDIQKKYYDKSFETIVSNTDFSQHDMFQLKEGENVKRRVTDAAERYNQGAEIVKAVQDGRASISPSIVAGINDPVTGAPIAGYNISIIPEKKDGKNSPDAPKRYYIPGLVNETASAMMMQDPTIQSFNSVSMVGATRSSKSLTDSNVNPRLGNITITGIGNNSFQMDFNGVKKVVPQETAVALTTAINNYNAVKSRFLAESYGKPDFKLTPEMKSTMVNAARSISHITGVSDSAVLDKLIDDINK